MNTNLINTLLVEDNPGDAFLIQQIFEQTDAQQFQLTHVEFLAQVTDLLKKADFDVILLDLSLPDSQGFDTLLTIENLAPSLPVVVLTGLNDEEIAIKAVRQGAQDYLVKGQFNRELLIRSIRYAIERKRLEEDLKQRTVELEAANQELQAFSYTVSHDLRNPLQNIEGFNYLIEVQYGEQLDEQGRHFIDKVHDNVMRMNQLIEDLLNLSGVQHHQLQCLPVDLSAMAKDIMFRLRQQQPERNSQFIVNSDVMTQGDHHLLQVALENLFGNAWKYTGKQELTQIEFGIDPGEQVKPQPINDNNSVSLPSSVKDKSIVYFVRDNGVGFDMNEAEQLFTPFKRLHSSQDFKGTGIGLATVERIIKRHGGDIWAESAVNCGTTFYFTLNCQEAMSCQVPIRA